MSFDLVPCLRAAIVLPLLIFVSTGNIFAEDDLGDSSVTDSSKIDFSPLEVGNEWQLPFISKSGKYIIWDALNMNTFFVVKNPLDPKMFQAR